MISSKGCPSPNRPRASSRPAMRVRAMSAVAAMAIPIWSTHGETADHDPFERREAEGRGLLDERDDDRGVEQCRPAQPCHAHGSRCGKARAAARSSSHCSSRTSDGPPSSRRRSIRSAAAMPGGPTCGNQVGNRAVVAHHHHGRTVEDLIQRARGILPKFTHGDCAAHTPMVVECRLLSICAGQRQMCRSAPVSESAEMSPEGWNLPGAVR